MLDIDAPRHSEAAGWWEANRTRLPRPGVHATRSGGVHVVFKSAPGLRCWTARPVLGVDGRSQGGYVIHWPSAGYPVLCTAQPAEWPKWLLDEIAPRRTATERPPMVYALPDDPGGRQYAMAALRRAAETVAGAPQGRRNEALNLAAWSLARFIPDALRPDEIADALAVAALGAGLSAREAQRTIASGLRRGVAP